MNIQKGCSTLTSYLLSGAIPDQQRPLGSSRNLHWVNATVPGLYHWNFHLLILVGTIVAPWRWLRNNEWEIIMGTPPLLCNARHRTMVTPVNLLRFRLIHISPSYWTVYRSLEIILECVLSIGLEFKSKCSMQTHCTSKKHSIWYELNWKTINCRGQLGLQWISPSKEQANVFERTVSTNDIFLFTSAANWTRKTDMKRKYEHWQDPMEKAWVNNRNQWSGWWHKHAKQARSCYNIKRSRRLGLIPSAGIATADTWFKCFCKKTFPQKHVLVLIDFSTLGTPQSHSIWISKR